MSRLALNRPRYAVEGLASSHRARVQDFTTIMRCAVRTRVSVRGPFAYDFRCDSPLIGHPQTTFILNVFSIFPMGINCCWANCLRGGMRRGVVDLGRLTRGWSGWGMDDRGILRAPFCVFVVLDEAGVGLCECLQLGV